MGNQKKNRIQKTSRKPRGESSRSARQDSHKKKKDFCVDFSLEKIKKNLQIRVFDEFGEFVLKGNQKDCIAFVLVSHGQKGWGAYSKNPFSLNRQHLSDLSDAEFQNATEDLDFFDQSFSSIRGGKFRHRVKWASRDNLMSLYAHHPCP